MRTTSIFFAVAAATFSQVSASESAQARYVPTNRPTFPQQTPYHYPPNQPQIQPPSPAEYSAARLAAASTALAANYNPAYRGSTPIYGRLKENDNDIASIPTAAPNEELLGPFRSLADAVESSVERSILGKVTSLPASEAARLRSSVIAAESGLLLPTTTGSAAPRASASENESEEEGEEEGEEKEEAGEKGKMVIPVQTEDGGEGGESSGAIGLRWEKGGMSGAVLFVIGLWFV